MKILVTGGAGYIGSHVVRMLRKEKHSILAYDNMSNGREDRVLPRELVIADLADVSYLTETFAEFHPDVVMHFASSISVPESVRLPITYYRNNVANTVNLLEVMQRFEVNKMIFSSSASVYGAYDRPVREDDACSPEHPYGASKSIIERMLSDLSHAEDFRFVALRYFNAAGADPSGLIGQSTKSPTHIIECALRTASGDLPELSIYGTDYPTPDGTCVRDYVHVNDIADAHILALEYLWRGGKSEVFNVGYGHGNSVREVVDMAHKVTGIDFTVIEAQRRDGDYPYLVADSRKIKDVLGWNPKYDSLETIIKTAWDWTRKESERKNHGTISR